MSMIHGLTEAVEATGVTFDPPDLDDALVARMERILLAIRETSIELTTLDLGQCEQSERFEALASIARARGMYKQCCRVKDNFDIGWERVHEVGARGPGRVARILCSWTVQEDGTKARKAFYPYGFEVNKFAISAQLALEGSAVSGDRG